MDELTLAALVEVIERSVYGHVDVIDGFDGEWVARDIAQFLAGLTPKERLALAQR